MRQFRRDLHDSRARIIDVIDGETVRVQTAGKVNRIFTVRLIAIDSPETREDIGVECGGKQALATMLNLAFTAARDADGDGLLDAKGGTGVSVVISTDPSQPVYDKSKRLLAYLDVPAEARGPGVGAYDLGRTMIATGYAVFFLTENTLNDPKRNDRYEQTEETARTGNLGVWSQCGGNFHARQR